MKKILVVNVNWLGDCVMTLPVFRAIKKKYPGSYLAVMAVPRVKDLFLNNPFIDEVVTFDEKGGQRRFIDKVRFVRVLRQKRFDEVFFIQRSFTRAFMCLCAGIPSRTGFLRRKTGFLLTGRVVPLQDVHRAEHYFSLFEASGIEVEDKVPECILSGHERREAEEYLRPYRERSRFLVAVNPSANWVQKRWPVEYFISAVRSLCKENATVFLIGASGEKDVIGSIKREVPEAVDLCGRTTLRQLAGILSGMDCLLSADSGPAHLAAALDIPVVVLFGPTSPEITAPRGRRVKVVRKDVRCRIPCYNARCEHNTCMTGIIPEEAVALVKKAVADG